MQNTGKKGQETLAKKAYITEVSGAEQAMFEQTISYFQSWKMMDPSDSIRPMSPEQKK
jgi:hypothetical protein